MKIHPGQYVAIVGQTGCGKSTLMRLLLGFEKPMKGAVYYDGKNLDKIDLKSLRQKIGVVMQNGKLFSGGYLFQYCDLGAMADTEGCLGGSRTGGYCRGYPENAYGNEYNDF